MDEFAKEYFKKLEGIAQDFINRRNELAQSRIKMFAASVYRQLSELHQSFDLIIGAGNSGLFMTYIAKKVYQQLGMTLPYVVNVPVYRFAKDKGVENNLILLPEIRNELSSLRSINNVLFVDDEIMRAITVKECLNLILKARPDIECLKMTIIAENHFFEWHYRIPKTSINFFAYSPLIQGLNGNIGYFIPKKFYEEIIETLHDSLTYNQVMAIVIGGALKRRDSKNHPYFDTEVYKDLKNRLFDYGRRRDSLTDGLEELIQEGIEEYSSGKIAFRF